ncbi:unnamed protein product [Nyctereutes procyonoides]|uniref:(raccoon dog) hypothetical protein n=1 Tax=Nyctereutes procyonoides TaxID=34880 RepID=A0A811YNA9_NYCPR|nr:unnamed protein product [Nyctereutes procyonoides]
MVLLNRRLRKWKFRVLARLKPCKASPESVQVCCSLGMWGHLAPGSKTRGSSPGPPVLCPPWPSLHLSLLSPLPSL